MTEPKEFKCVVWDLDDTLWDGVLLEGDHIQLKEGIPAIVAELDRRGILQSIASKNEPDLALQKLREFGVLEYFLYPQIGWNAKSSAMGAIAEELNLGLDSFVFIDDQVFERDEVRSVHPAVTTVDAADYRTLLDLPRMNPRFITDDSTNRRRMYIAEHRRKEDQRGFQGPELKFLESLGMKMRVTLASVDDLQRAEELTIRTNQLNSTGIAYSYSELRELRESRDHQLLVCELTDRYGSYGKIGLALLQLMPEELRVKLILMSCRVASRGVGAVLLTHILREAARTGRRPVCDFTHTGRNRMMYATLKFQGFADVLDGSGQVTALAYEGLDVPEFPKYIEVLVDVEGEGLAA